MGENQMYAHHDGRAYEPVGNQGDGELAPDGSAAQDAAQQLVAHLSQHWPHHRPQPEHAWRSSPLQLDWLCMIVIFTACMHACM